MTAIGLGMRPLRFVRNSGALGENVSKYERLTYVIAIICLVAGYMGLRQENGALEERLATQAEQSQNDGL